MKAELHKQIINSIKLNQVYEVTINGKKKDMSGLDFRSHINVLWKKILDEDGKELLTDITKDTKKQEVKQVDKKNGSAKTEQTIPQETKQE